MPSDAGSVIVRRGACAATEGSGNAALGVVTVDDADGGTSNSSVGGPGRRRGAAFTAGVVAPVRRTPN